MIQSFTITNYIGESIFIDIRKPQDTGFLISSVTGLGPVKADISRSETGIFDGSIISNSRLESRNIVFNIVFFEDNADHLDIEDIRHKSYKYFPPKKEVKIVTTNEHGDYEISGIVETNDVPIFTKTEGTQVSIICEDPYFTKGEETSKYVSRVVPNFEFPVSFEAELSNIPDEEDQDDEGLEKIVAENGEVFYRYHGPFSVTSEAFNSQVLGTAGKFSYDNITVNEIPYSEEINESGGKTIKIGG